MRVIVGLGNPGRRYAATRHNAGFWCVDALARRHHIRLGQRRRLAVLGEGAIGDEDVVLAKPRTYMNASGDAVRYLLDRFHPSLEEVLVIYDDLDLPTGRVRLRPTGSAAGHRGMASIIAALGTQDFPRLRIGIGRPSAVMDEVAYVLGRPTGDERRGLEEAVERAADAVEIMVAEGLDIAMSRVN